jgi:hypothetical protein
VSKAASALAIDTVDTILRIMMARGRGSDAG